MDTRRDFLKKAALLSGAAGLFGALPASIQKAFAIDPDSGTTYRDAEHVVILMQENRSFDHCLGTLQGVRGFNDPRAITLPNQNPVWLQTNARGETHAPFRLDIKHTKATWMGSLPHSWPDQVDARNHGKHDQWLEAKRSGHKEYAPLPLTLGYYTREDVPFYYALADAFTVCDQHFCSSLTATMPNRLYLWSGTVRGGNPTDAPAKVLNSDIEYESSANWTTFPERLEENKISWKIYQNELSLAVGFTTEEAAWLANYGDNPLEWFDQYHAGFSPAHQTWVEGRIAALPAEIETLKTKLQSLTEGTPEAHAAKRKLDRAEALLQSLRERRTRYGPEKFAQLTPRERNLHAKAFTTNTGDPAHHELATLRYQDGTTRRQLKVPKGDVLHQFRRDVEGGQLPAVSWIVAPENFSDHPSSAWYGAWYVSEVLDILTHNPDVWKKTIFLLTYDENDGYFDHVPPFVVPHPNRPETGLTSAGIDTAPDYVTLEEESRRKPAPEARESSIGLGYRVPLMIVSPWSRGGCVCSQVFDHTSVLRFLETFLSGKTGRKIVESNISAWRRAVCGDLTSAFRPHHGEPIALPSFPPRETFIEGIHQAQFKQLPPGRQPLTKEEIQRARQGPASAPFLPRQEPGVRPSCPLPYELYADGALDHDRKTFEISFAAGNSIFGPASAGAPFNVHAPGKHRVPASRPGSGITWETCKTWAFAAAAGAGLAYSWPLEDFESGRYHLRVYGPNGFFREFKGDRHDPPLDARCGYGRAGGGLSGRIELALTHTAAGAPCSIQIQDNAYKNPNQAAIIPPATRKLVVVGSDASSGWYDFTLRVPGNETFAWRFAGRVETGKPGVTDPAMAGM